MVQVRDMQVADRNAEPSSSSGAGVGSHGAGTAAAVWESKDVSSK